MRFILIPRPPHLPKRWITICTNRLAELMALTTGAQRTLFLSKKTGWNLLKTWLSKYSGQKCWYCEYKSPRATFDVDHFRPKLGLTVDGKEITSHLGYYWLAYEWSNFRLSCQRCNRPEKDESETLRGKSQEFPLQNEADRCNTHTASIETESPRFLDPCTQSDCDLLAHCIDGEVKPLAPTGSWEYVRARYTIDQLGFNQWNTPEDKRSAWQTISILIRVSGTSPAPEVTDEVKRYLSDEQEYSSFFRAAIGTHRDKTWVEQLL